MELSESIAQLNLQLIDLYGIDTVTGQAIWRIVWSDDQREKRKSKYTASGIELPYAEVLELPKYAYQPHKHILEKLELVPERQQDELVGLKISYEPKFVFESASGQALPPRLDVCQLVIGTMNFAQFGHKSGLAKYKDDEDGEKLKSIARIEQEYFGNETDVTDALRYKEGVVLPSKFFGENDVK